MSAVLITINFTLGIFFEHHFFGGGGGGGGKTALPPLISEWEKLEPGNFIIMYTIMYAYKIYKKFFIDINIFLITSSNTDFTIRRRHETQYFGNF